MRGKSVTTMTCKRWNGTFATHQIAMALTHPRESIQAYRAEAKYLQELIQDLNI